MRWTSTIVSLDDQVGYVMVEMGWCKIDEESNLPPCAVDSADMRGVAFNQLESLPSLENIDRYLNVEGELRQQKDVDVDAVLQRRFESVHPIVEFFRAMRAQK